MGQKSDAMSQHQRLALREERELFLEAFEVKASILAEISTGFFA